MEAKNRLPLSQAELFYMKEKIRVTVLLTQILQASTLIR